MNQKGVIHLVLPLVFIVLIGAAVFTLIYFGLIKNPFSSLPFGQKGLKIELKKEYANPFKKESQYVNPFETYKNPFEVAK